MTIEEYFSKVKALLDQYAVASFVIDSQVSFETRSSEQGFLIGRTPFIDGSSLHCREYLDTVGEKIDKVMYSYHYQDSQDQTIFRYDNAAHKPSLGFSEHKHDRKTILAASAPYLEQVLLEIVGKQGWA